MESFLIERFGSQQYIGEHLFIGYFGQFVVLLSFFAALLAAISYAAASYQKNGFSWLRIGTAAWIIHGLCVVSTFLILFIMIFNHYFEYHYVWSHSSTTLPLRYMVSCFWEGQEGSFLLWQFWHVVLGGILILKAKTWRAPVMTIFALVQLLLGSMLLGIYVGSHKIGANPFILLRDVLDAPIFNNPNYVSFIEDGNGLNPLLQNYWMVIHPPVLFLGFASTLVPFAYALAALWKNDLKNWVIEALPWTLFSAAMLGTGILMGGAWAYEALSFGGFWAWDPVENASLVPWLTLIAGLHCLVIYRSTKHALRAGFLFLLSTFILILYSTFLTRSGILGDTSVHSFTDLGMSGQLIFYILFFLIPTAILFAIRYKNIPSPKKEEPTWSKEFWMFVGALILLISALQISFTTSIPVWNNIIGSFADLASLDVKRLSGPADAEAHYNSFQVWIAIVIGLLTALIQFFYYRKNLTKQDLIPIVIPILISLAVTGLFYWYFNFKVVKYSLMLLASVYAVIGNIYFLFHIRKKPILNWGGGIAHLGFGMMLLGILISQHKQEVISINQEGIHFGEGYEGNEQRENLLLRKDVPTEMGDYLVSYQGMEISQPDNFYLVHYEQLDESGELLDSFTLKPNAQINPNMGLIANPDTRHFLTKDVFTHVSSVPKEEEQDENKWEMQTVAEGDTFFSSKYFIVFDKLISNPAVDSLKFNDTAIGLAVQLNIHGFDGSSYKAQPIYVIESNGSNQLLAEKRYDHYIKEIGHTFSIARPIPKEQKISIKYKEDAPFNDFIIMKAIIFPYINVLWLGCLVMLLGFFISMTKRRKEKKLLY